MKAYILQTICKNQQQITHNKTLVIKFDISLHELVIKDKADRESSHPIWNPF